MDQEQKKENLYLLEAHIQYLNMIDILEKFTLYIQQIGYSKSSQYQMPYCIKEFLEVIQKPFNSIQQQDILDFYEYLQ